MHGEIAEQPDAPHVRRRQELLCGSHRFPEPGPVTTASAAGFLPAGVPGLLADLAERGFAMRQLDRPLDTCEFRALGDVLGSPIPETDEQVRPFVEDGVVLNLISRHTETSDVGLQPFATNYLSLHTEGSGRPVAQQPRYLVLMCREPGDGDGTAQTVLTPMAGVAARLAPEHTRTLARTCYRHAGGDPWIARDQDGRTVFSFRDFMGQTLRWTHDGHATDARTVDDALRALLDAMYHPDGMVAVRWQPGLLVVFDNTFFFHGRTARVGPLKEPRHLMRLRVATARPAGTEEPIDQRRAEHV
ncbi:TauD/TfdA family dioxygenase [Streptomyces olivaceoviridis]|uniref:TauD/TfdA family dioxygenase n=1 Tax=Streptomyces olivaceoviridis TaxID=1921 RepID=UPI00331C3F73